MANTESKKIGPYYDAAAKAIDSGLKKAQNPAAATFQAISNMAKSESAKIGPFYAKAGEAIAKAMSDAEKKASKSLGAIAKSADTASKSVAALASKINSLKDKTVTITTKYKEEGKPSSGGGKASATGFGPTVVDHPMNLKVGEAGPEYVSVVPLNSAASKNLSAEQRLLAYADPGKERRHGTGIPNIQNIDRRTVSNTTIGGAVTNNSVTESSTSDIINRFNQSVSRISNAYAREESKISTTNNVGREIGSIQNVRIAGNTSMTRNANTAITNTAIPDASSVRSGGIAYNSYGGGGGSMLDRNGVIDMVREIIREAMGNTTINLSNTTNVDGEKVDLAVQRRFGLKNGAMLK